MYQFNLLRLSLKSGRTWMYLLFTYIFFWLNPLKTWMSHYSEMLHIFMKCASSQTKTRNISVFYFHSSPVQAVLKRKLSLNLLAFPILSNQRKKHYFHLSKDGKNVHSVGLTYWCYFPLIGEGFILLRAGKWILTGAALKTCRKGSLWLKWIIKNLCLSLQGDVSV